MSDIEVEMPDGNIAVFPSGTDPATMTAELERYLSRVQGRTPPRRPDQQRTEMSALSAATQNQPIPVTPRADQSFAPRPGAPNGTGQTMPADPSQSANPPQNTGRNPRGEAIQAAIAERQAMLADPNLPQAQRDILEAQAARAEKISNVLNAGVNGVNAVGDVAQTIGNTGRRALGHVVGAVDLERGASLLEGGREKPVDLIPTSNAGNMEREAQESAREAARLREEQGITSARGSMGDNITQGNPEAAAVQADAARAEVAGTDAPRERPTTAAGQGAAGPELQFPQSLSTRDARPGQTAQNPETMSFNMGDGSAVQIRTIPKRARDNAVRDGMAFQQQQANRLIRSLIERGDISKAMEFRTFMNEQQTQRGMTEMNRAVAAASYGDSAAFTTALDRMVSSFDPDGPWQVNTKETKLIEQDGQAVGAILSLTNKDTGEVMNQEYLGMQEVIGGISRWGSPDSQFEYQKDRVTAAASQRIANAESFQNAYDEAMEAMFDKKSFVDLEGNAIGREEMARRHELVIERITQVRPDLVPTNQQGAASGVGAGGFTGGSNGQPVPTLAN
ncbi:hypothetical protein [Yoonia sp.]|uniref:hypothetical protein n=1 Tax=Yoonia sp. TaxID=2212373 RepID=UPI002E000EDB|nr:hypothetical protein [Yoonia sp.]